jgi:hypothetical protein
MLNDDDPGPLWASVFTISICILGVVAVSFLVS